ncbi:MAG TPA: TonB family protein [Thermoanaerobaculia bacterium]|nr:TonB family protein [Thermoanaerobaculia bacterium]
MNRPPSDSRRSSDPDPGPAKAGSCDPSAGIDDRLAPYLCAATGDDRLLRRAIAAAVLFHALLFLIHLPGAQARTEIPPPERQVYVLRSDRFRPPEPDRRQELPELRTRRVPMPDPTPDAPEPLRAAEPEVFDLAAPEDVVLGVPQCAPEPAPDLAPVRLTAEMERPVKLWAPMPEYTEIARRARIQGPVVLEAVIGVDGSVRDVEVLRALPMGLSEAAARAVARWRYRPATLDGQPLAVILTVTVDFSLQ